MLNAIRVGGVLLIMAAAAVWYAYDQAGATRARDHADVANAYHGGGGGGGGGGGAEGSGSGAAAATSWTTRGGGGGGGTGRADCICGAGWGGGAPPDFRSSWICRSRSPMRSRKGV